MKIADKFRIASVVVTYNRKELVAENIIATLNQSLKVDKIIVVNNCSTDGTEEYLNNRFVDETKIEVISLDQNYGGAGGFYYGLKYAIDLGFDYVFLMDDDGRPYNDQCFENLFLSIIESDYNKPIMINSMVIQNESKLTFGLGKIEFIEEAYKKAENGIVTGIINPFNGTLISRKLVETIGYPNKDFFIKGDEVDYYARAIKATAVVHTAVNSLYYHPAPPNMKQKKFFGKSMYVYAEASWKEYYNVRNATYRLKTLVGKKAAFKYFLKSLFRITVIKCDKLKIYRAMMAGYNDGMTEKLGRLDRDL